MRDNWCKNCNQFVQIRKDYSRAIIRGIIYLSVLVVGLVVWFPWGGLIGLVVIICFEGVARPRSARPACIICGKTTGKKRIKKVEEKADYKDLDWLRHQRYELGKSVQDLANEQGVSMLTISKWLDKLE